VIISIDYAVALLGSLRHMEHEVTENKIKEALAAATDEAMAGIELVQQKGAGTRETSTSVTDMAVILQT
jgi:hypothetical protein